MNASRPPPTCLASFAVGNTSDNEIKFGLVHFSNYTISDEATAEEIIDAGLSQLEATRIHNWLSRKIIDSKRTGGDISTVLS